MTAADERRASLAARFERWLGDAGGRVRRGRLALVLAGGYVLFAATYLPINRFSAGRPAYSLFLPGEERIPFVPVFTYLYVLTHLIAGLLIVTIRDHATFLRLARATGLALFTAYATYLVAPVYLHRPTLVVDSLHTWLLSVVYLDGSYNHFPSLHVTLSWLAVHASQVSRRGRLGLAGLATGISLSTLLVKQHYVLDVAAGFLLAWVAWRLAAAPRAPSCAPQEGAGAR